MTRYFVDQRKLRLRKKLAPDIPAKSTLRFHIERILDQIGQPKPSKAKEQS